MQDYIVEVLMSTVASLTGLIVMANPSTLVIK